MLGKFVEIIHRRKEAAGKYTMKGRERHHSDIMNWKPYGSDRSALEQSHIATLELQHRRLHIRIEGIAPHANAHVGHTRAVKQCNSMHYIIPIMHEDAFIRQRIKLGR